MTKRATDHEALLKSIQKWEQINKGFKQDGGNRDCALCQLYNKPDYPGLDCCKGCPIFEDSGEQFCRAIYKLRDLLGNSPELEKEHNMRMLNYLRELADRLKPVWGYRDGVNFPSLRFKGVFIGGGGGGGGNEVIVGKEAPTKESLKKKDLEYWPHKGRSCSPHGFWTIFEDYCTLVSSSEKKSDDRRQIHSVFLHCSATDVQMKDKDLIDSIDHWHNQRGFDGIGYHAVINRSGTILLGRSMFKPPAAQKGYNTGSIAICVHGNLEFTSEQMATVKLLKTKGPAQLRWRGHKEVSNKTCPNFDYKELLDL